MKEYQQLSEKLKHLYPLGEGKVFFHFLLLIGSRASEIC